jgi:hypothetical protein
VQYDGAILVGQPGSFGRQIKLCIETQDTREYMAVEIFAFEPTIQNIYAGFGMVKVTIT